jgi:hypothetical protein
VKSNVSFLEAIHEANKYVGWYKRKVLKQLWIAPDIGYESPAKE